MYKEKKKSQHNIPNLSNLAEWIIELHAVTENLLNQSES
jgi:hypothetical protein